MKKSFLLEFKGLLSVLSQRATYPDCENAKRNFGYAIGNLDRAFVEQENLEKALADTVMAIAILVVAHKIEQSKISIKPEREAVDPVARLYSHRYFLSHCGFNAEDTDDCIRCILQIISQHGFNINRIITLTKNEIANHGKQN